MRPIVAAVSAEAELAELSRAEPAPHLLVGVWHGLE